MIKGHINNESSPPFNEKFYRYEPPSDELRCISSAQIINRFTTGQSLRTARVYRACRTNSTRVDLCHKKTANVQGGVPCRGRTRPASQPPPRIVSLISTNLRINGGYGVRSRALPR